MNKEASVQMIGAAIAIAVTIMISILIVYSIGASINPVTLNKKVYPNNPAANPVGNATNATYSGLATFYTIAPLIIVVLAAVVILNYVTKVGQ